MTGTALINKALILIGILAPGRSASSEEYTHALTQLNELIGSWTADNRGVFSVTRDIHAMTGTNEYSWGLTGNINTARPVRILAASMAHVATAYESPIKIVGAAEWHAIDDKTRSGKFSRALFCDYQSPLAHIFLWPIPIVGSSLIAVSLKPLTTWASLATDVTLPEGYDRALVYNLAVTLAPQFAGSKLDEATVRSAEISRDALFALNEKLLLEANASADAPEVTTE